MNPHVIVSLGESREHLVAKALRHLGIEMETQGQPGPWLHSVKSYLRGSIDLEGLYDGIKFAEQYHGIRRRWGVSSPDMIQILPALQGASFDYIFISRDAKDVVWDMLHSLREPCVPAAVYEIVRINHEMILAYTGDKQAILSYEQILETPMVPAKKLVSHIMGDIDKHLLSKLSQEVETIFMR